MNTLEDFKEGSRVKVSWDKAPRFDKEGVVAGFKDFRVKVKFEDQEVYLYEPNDLDILPTDAPDNVNHPSHYCSDPSGVECIEVTMHRNFCVGNAMKYLWRAGLKQDADKTAKEKTVEDLRKAAWYINKEIERLEGC